jgi:predicted DNA-binding protein (MmcQ/YjbR family)
MIKTLADIEHRLRATALAQPEATEEFPWGESAFKVRGKTFLFLHHADGALSLSMKLPASNEFARMLDFTEPTGYGLGKSGWITCRLGADTDADLELIERWIGESWCAVAPKKLAAGREREAA